MPIVREELYTTPQARFIKSILSPKSHANMNHVMCGGVSLPNVGRRARPNRTISKNTGCAPDVDRAPSSPDAPIRGYGVTADEPPSRTPSARVYRESYSRSRRTLGTTPPGVRNLPVRRALELAGLSSPA